MKLIDVEHIPYEDGFDRVHGNEHFIFGVETMQEWIRDQPIIDPEDLRPTGEWIEVDDGVSIGDGKHLECKNCGVWKKDRQKSNYCPNCGAKMRKEDDVE